MNHRSFSDLAYDNKKKVTRKACFLNEMDSIIPWDLLLSAIAAKRIKNPVRNSLMSNNVLLRCYFMQQWYGLSGPAMEDSLYDVESMRRFAGVTLYSIPTRVAFSRSTRKGNNWHYGMKIHVGSDLRGRVHHVKVMDD